MDYIQGKCHGTAEMHFEHHGVTITKFGAGESQESPFNMLNDIELDEIHTTDPNHQG